MSKLIAFDVFHIFKNQKSLWLKAGILFCASFSLPVVLAGTALAQVNGSGVSDPALFDEVVDVSTDMIDGLLGFPIDVPPGETVQVNVLNGGAIGDPVLTSAGAEVNLFSGGFISIFGAAEAGSEFNILGGDLGGGFSARSGSQVNISGGTNMFAFHAFAGSEVNLFGSDFLLDGVPVAGLIEDVPTTISDRGAQLTGFYEDGSPFSFDLNTISNLGGPDDFFSPDATLTLTLVAETVDDFLCDVNQDGEVNFMDIAPFIEVLAAGTFLAEADCNLDGEVNFFDIAPFIVILSGV